MLTQGRTVTGKLVQGEDGYWREVPVPVKVQRASRARIKVTPKADRPDAHDDAAACCGVVAALIERALNGLR